MSANRPSDQQTEERVHSTYRYLRLVAVMPAIWLILAIFVVAAFQGKFYESISDYYGGPLRDVFVGALMASGICLVAYKGESRLEDYVLNFAGVNTFIVALIPNSFPDLLAQARVAEGTMTPPPVPSADLLENLGIAVATLLIIAAVFACLDSRFFRWTRLNWRDIGPFSKALIVTSWVLELVVLVVVICVLVAAFSDSTRTWPFTWAHFSAASFMIVNFVFAAASHAFPDRLRSVTDAPADDDNVRTAFRIIAIGMALGLVAGTPAIALGVHYSVIVVEIYEILFFIAFWIVATREEWRRVARPTQRLA